jgi:phospholipase C
VPEDTRVTRTGFSPRTLLTGAATVSGATAASLARCRPACTRRWPPPQSFSPKEIKHVVLAMQGNRGFVRDNKPPAPHGRGER